MAIKRIDDFDPSALGTVWKQIHRTELGAPAASISISDLNGNVHGIYQVYFKHIRDAVDGNGLIRLNGDSGANYGDQFVRGQNVTASAARTTNRTGLIGSNVSAAGPNASDFFQIFAKSGKIRQVLSLQGGLGVGTTPDSAFVFYQLWNNSADNIISMTVLGTAGNLGTGTIVEVYAPVAL